MVLYMGMYYILYTFYILIEITLILNSETHLSTRVLDKELCPCVEIIFIEITFLKMITFFCISYFFLSSYEKF